MELPLNTYIDDSYEGGFEQWQVDFEPEVQAPVAQDTIDQTTTRKAKAITPRDTSRRDTKEPYVAPEEPSSGGDDTGVIDNGPSKFTY